METKVHCLGLQGIGHFAHGGCGFLSHYHNEFLEALDTVKVFNCYINVAKTESD